jgi:hypothetical protein
MTPATATNGKPTALDVARNYLSRGYAPLPLGFRQKAITREGWQDLRLTDADLPREFAGRKNIGVLTGEPSGWLIDVDLDHELAVELADEYLPLTRSEFGRAGKPRSHRLFVVTAPIATHKRQTPKDENGKRQMIVELRSTGCQTVFPGSVHEGTGEPIEWVIDEEPTAIDPTELKAAVDALADEVMRRLGMTGRPAQRSESYDQSARAATNGADISERVRRYLATIPPAIEKNDGSGQTFYVACRLVLGFGLTPDQAWPFMLEYNERCEPPWNEKELRHKLDDANKEGGERGFLLRDDRSNSNTSAPARTSNAATPAPNRPDAEQREPVKFTRITSKELATSVYEIEYLIDRFLVARQPCIFAGPKKALKTTLLVTMAVALARGVQFLGRFEVAQARRVLVMSGESGVSVLQETARRVCHWHNCDLANLDNLIWSTDLPQIANLDHLDALAYMLRENEIEVIVIDPAYLCLSTEASDAANLFAMGTLLGNLSRICQEQGATLVLAHHTRKGNIADPFEPPELEHIAFAGFQEFCRQWILVGRRERYEHGTGSHRLWLSTGGSAGHSGLWGCDIEEGTNTAAEGRTFDCALLSAEAVINNAKEQAAASKESAQRDRDAGHRNRAVRLLFKAGRPMTKTQWRALCGINGPTMDRIVMSLLDSESIVNAEVKHGNRKTGYAGFDVSAAERDRLAKLAVHEQAGRADVAFDANERGQD